MQPFNYSLGGQSPMDAFRGALSLGTDIQQAELDTMKLQAQKDALKKQKSISEAFELLKRPGATARDYMNLAMMLPKEQSEALQSSFKTLKEEERQAALIDSSKVFSAFKSGRPDIAVALIRQQAEAERNSGNEQGAKLAEEWAKMAESGEAGAQAVENMFGFTIAHLPGGDKAIDGTVKLASELRTAKEFPVLMEQKQQELAKAKTDAEKAAIELKHADKLASAQAAKAETDAQIAKIELETLPALKAQALAKATSEAEKARIEATFLEREKSLNLKVGNLTAAEKEIVIKTLAAQKQAELDKATSDAEIAAINVKYAPRERELGIKEKEITLATLADEKKAELAKATSEAAVAAINAKYADREKVAIVNLAEGKATEQNIVLKTLEDERTIALANAKSVAQQNAVKAEFATKMQLAELNAKAAEYGLTIANTDKAIIDKAIATAQEARAVTSYPDEQAKLAAETRLTNANADAAEIVAKYKNQIMIKELEKLGLDLQLTDAQKNKAIVEGTKISAETAKLLLETDALRKTGGMSISEIFNQEDKIRKEYIQRIASYNTMRTVYGTIETSAKDASGAGDMALVFGFMRMLDPDSVVRESEFANAQDTAGLVGKLKATYNKIVNGQFLTPLQRADMARLAKLYMDAATAHEKRVRDDLSVAVKNYGLNPANIFGTQAPDKPFNVGQTQVEVDF